MNGLIKEINDFLDNIDEFWNNNFIEQLSERYIYLSNRIDININELLQLSENDKIILSNFYSSYAYFLFKFAEYNLFFVMYIKAQKYGYDREKRRRFVYKAFLEPNINEFKEIYEKNLKNMVDKGLIKKNICFEELRYWLITTGEKNEFYLYDKQTDLIKNRIQLNFDYTGMDNQENLIIDNVKIEFDCLFTNILDWINSQSNRKESYIERRTEYIIINDFLEFLSFFQGTLISEYYLSKIILLYDINEFKSFFYKSSKSLPRVYFGSKDKKNVFENIINNIHEDRIKNDNRIGNDIVLSICIPSFNRGDKAYNNIINILRSDFDEEIQIVISDNGTENETKEFYNKIREIEDSRVLYHRYEKNQGFAINICKCIEIASGKYALILSDEDYINLEQLNYLVNFLKYYKKSFSIIRTNTDFQSKVPFVGIAEKGIESLRKFMLTSNYVSGMIFNRDLLSKLNLINITKENLCNDAFYYYPHMIWEIMACQYEDMLGLNMVLINEGKAEQTDVLTKKIGIMEEINIPIYATIEGRIKQHQGFFYLIKDLEIIKNDFNIFRELYLKLCLKKLFLARLSMNVYYNKSKEVDSTSLIESVYSTLVFHLDYMYKNINKIQKITYLDDKNEINKYCKYYLNYK